MNVTATAAEVTAREVTVTCPPRRTAGKSIGELFELAQIVKSANWPLLWDMLESEEEFDEFSPVVKKLADWVERNQ